MVKRPSAALVANATRMNFFQFCTLLELSDPTLPGLGTGDSPGVDRVRFRSREDLGFPQQAIDSAHWIATEDAANLYGEGCNTDANSKVDKRLEVRTTFLGLYGVDARMPAYFLDAIAQRHDGAEELAAFLDMFHHRFVTQFYRIWKKYRYPFGYRTGGSDSVSRCLLSLAGLGIGTKIIEDDVFSMRGLTGMLGLISQRTRTEEGLVGVLRHAVPDADIFVSERFKVWMRAEPGMVSALGDNCSFGLLGRGCYDRGNTVLVVMTPHTRKTVLGLVPGGTDHRHVLLWLKLYVGYTSNVRLQMDVGAGLMPAPYMKSLHVKLGLTSQLRHCSSHDRGGGHVSEVRQRHTRVTLGTWTAGSACHSIIGAVG